MMADRPSHATLPWSHRKALTTFPPIAAISMSWSWTSTSSAFAHRRRSKASGFKTSRKDTITTTSGDCLPDMTAGSLLVGFSDLQNFHVFRFTETTAELTYESATPWNGYASVQCVTPGAVRGNEADFWFCADADLVKVTLASLGTLK